LGTPAEGGASVTVTVDGNLSMATSGIFSRDGGNVTVNAGGEIDLSQNNFDFKTTDCYGIYTSGHSDVSVTANGNINIGSARIATFNGGNVFVESYDGSVDAGNGVTEALNVHGFYTDPVTGRPAFVEFGDLANEVSLRIDPAPYGSGILAEIPTEKYQTGGISQPGNITVLTPHGNIVAARGGISQLALNGSIAGGPTLTLIAGIAGITDPLDPDAGNILLGEGGVIGGTVTVTATGKIKGYFVSRQNLNVTGQSFSGLGLAGQDANFSTKQAGDSIPIIIGIGKVNAEGLGPADIMGQNVSIDGGTAQSTLGTSVNASSASQSAANQSDNEAKQQLASDSTGSDDEKKKKKQPAIQRTKRVTVILPKA